MKLDDLLKSGNIIIADGGLGTCLQHLSGTPVELPETFCLDPGGQDLIRQVHQSYVRAGARIIETNTFAANPWRLARMGLAEQCEQINSRAVELARSVVGAEAAVVGSIGPLDLGLAVRDFTEFQLREPYHNQMSTLAESGVDGLLLETFSSVDEARGALSEARETGLPILFSMGGLAVCQPYSRKVVLDLVDLAEEFEVRALGINCVTPYDLSQLLPVLADRTTLPLMACPNAGTPTVQRGLVRYDLPSAVLLAEARQWYHKGVMIFGGCCGTLPEHIQALHEHFAARSAVIRTGRFAEQPAVAAPPRSEVQSDRKIAATASATTPTAVENPLRRRLAESIRPMVAVEVRPSLGRSLRQTVETLAPVAQARPDLFDVPDNPGGNLGRDCLACALMLQQQYEIPTIIHKSATQTNALHLHSYLLGAAELGIRGILAITGDPPSVGPFDRWASRVTDLKSSIELIRLMGLMRSGLLLSGQPLPEPVDFLVGCGYAPTVNLAGQTQWLHRKIQAGAEFVFTQPIYLAEDFDRMHKATGDVSIPIFVGLLPLTSARQISYLRSGKIPGIVVPEPVSDAILGYADAESQAKAGMELTEKLIVNLAKKAAGFYVIMPFHRDAAAMTTRLVDLVKHLRPSS